MKVINDYVGQKRSVLIDSEHLAITKVVTSATTEWQGGTNSVFELVSTEQEGGGDVYLLIASGADTVTRPGYSSGIALTSTTIDGGLVEAADALQAMADALRGLADENN